MSERMGRENAYVSTVYDPRTLANRNAQSVKTLEQSHIDLIRRAQRATFAHAAAKNPTLFGFLNDPTISPSPQLNLDLSTYPKDKPLEFTISFLPPKSQSPTQSNRKTPDFAEVASLVHFEELAKYSEQVYRRPVRFTILTEATYAYKILGVPKKEAKGFRKDLFRLSRKVVRNERVTLGDWYKSVSRLPGYRKAFKTSVNSIEDSLKRQDAATQKEFDDIFPTVSSYLGGDPARSTRGTIRLMAWNRVRVLCKERESYKGLIHGSLHKSPGKFSFYSIGETSRLYPHHGEGILNSNTGEVVVLPSQNVTDVENSQYLRLARRYRS